MMPYAVTPMPSVSATQPATAAALTDALASEARLLGELAGIMRGQREAVAADDLGRVDESVFATQRVLHTLGEARRRRHMLYRMIGVPEDAGPRALAAVMGADLPAALRAALDELIAAARTLSGEVALNRRVLRAALAAGDDYARVLTGGEAAAGGYPAPPAPGAPARHGGALINCQA
jgi:hypothetical protein